MRFLGYANILKFIILFFFNFVIGSKKLWHTGTAFDWKHDGRQSLELSFDTTHNV